MISIIICSREPELLQAVSENVAATIGVAYEIIAIDNRDGQYGICKAYNIGASKSKFDVLCFMHEDLIFHTSDWGKRVLKHLQNPTVGLIGVAGGTYKSKSLDAWGIDPLEYTRMNVLQDFKSDGRQEHYFHNPYNELVADVVTVDGMWLCTWKEVWSNNKFDEINFREFHFYDMDFSMQVLKSHRVCVVFDILIQHMSEGSMNKSWLENAIIFHRKWRRSLPLSLDGIYDKKKKQVELRRAELVLDLMHKYDFKGKIYWKYYLRYAKLNSIERNLVNLMKFINRNLKAKFKF